MWNKQFVGSLCKQCLILRNSNKHFQEYTKILYSMKKARRLVGRDGQWWWLVMRDWGWVAVTRWKWKYNNGLFTSGRRVCVSKTTLASVVLCLVEQRTSLSYRTVLRFSEQRYWSHNPCVTYYVVIIMTKSSYPSVRENNLYGAGIFHQLTSAASFPGSVSIVIIAYLGISKVGVYG